MKLLLLAWLFTGPTFGPDLSACKWFTAVWQVVLEESVVRETSQEAFRVGCWGWREVKMVRISERRVRSRHLLDRGLEESERKGSVGGRALQGTWVPL